jgi:hypothetical protein
MRIYFYVPAFAIGLLCGIIATILYFKSDVQDCYVAKGAAHAYSDIAHMAVGDILDDVRELRSNRPITNDPIQELDDVYMCSPTGKGFQICPDIIANLTVDENGIYNFKPGGE